MKKVHTRLGFYYFQLSLLIIQISSYHLDGMVLESHVEEAKGTIIKTTVIRESGKETLKTVIFQKSQKDQYILFTNEQGKHVKTEGSLVRNIDQSTLWEVGM